MTVRLPLKMSYNLTVLLSFLHLLVYVISLEQNHTGFPEETLISNSSMISCAGNKTITIVDLNVEQYPTTCSEYKHCNLTEQETNAIKKRCNKNPSCTISRIIPESCLFNSYGHVSVSYSCTRTVNGSCTFENNICGWSISSNGTYEWIRGRGKSPENFTGPNRDTTSSGDGYYIYTMSETGSQPNEETDLLSGLIGPNQEQCLTFWYHMYGDQINTLEVFKLNDNRIIELWNASDNQGNNWYFQSLSLNDTGQGPYRINFRAIRGNGSKSEIAVDDIFITNTDCKKALFLDCTFESDKCNWLASSNNRSYIWTTNKTGDSTRRPDNDHTIGTVGAHYIYLQDEGIEMSDMTSKFTSAIINPDGDICLTFWYYMYIINPDTLNVYTESGNTTQLRWSQNGSHLNQWNFASFTISKSEPYRIIFEGVRGTGYWSIIALDDILLLERSCSGLIKTSQKCHNIDESVSLNGCSKHYLQLNDTSLVFYPEFDNCSVVYQDVQKSITTSCNDMKYSDICTFNLPELIMGHKRCFQSNWLSVEYKCEAEVIDTVSSVDTSSKGSSEAAETTMVTVETYSSIGSSVDDTIVNAVVVSTLVIIIVVALMLTVIVFHFKKRTNSSKLCDVRPITTITETIDSSGYNIINYNNMSGISIPEKDKNRHDINTTNRQLEDIKTAIEQEDTICNNYESLSANRHSVEHTYESDSILINQYESFTKQRESDKHKYESTEHALPVSMEQELSPYQSLTNPPESDKHVYASTHTNQYESLSKQRESDKHTYESTEHALPVSMEQELSPYQALTCPLESDKHEYASTHTN